MHAINLPRPSKEFHVVGLSRSWHKSDTAILFILLDCPANGGARSWAWGGIRRAVTTLESLLRAPPDAHCTLLTKTCVYHVWHSSIGPELRRYASHSSFNICGVLLGVEARFHCQPLVWRENNVSAEVVNVGESCMQKCKLQCMLDCIYSLIAARLTQIQIPHLCTYQHLCLLRLRKFALHRQPLGLCGVLPLHSLLVQAVRSQLQASTRRESRQCKLLWKIVSSFRVCMQQ